MVRKFEVCSITVRLQEDDWCGHMEGSVKNIKKQDSAETPPGPGLWEE